MQPPCLLALFPTVPICRRVHAKETNITYFPKTLNQSVAAGAGAVVVPECFLTANSIPHTQTTPTFHLLIPSYSFGFSGCAVSRAEQTWLAG